MFETGMYQSAVKCVVLLTVMLALLPNLAAAEVGPALSGLTGSANDATSVFFSPAGITRLEQPEMVIQAAFMFKESKFEVDEATYSGGDSDNDQQIALIPGVFYARPLNERWHLGLSLNVPSGFGNNYGDRWSGRYHTQESTLAFVAATGVVAYEVTDNFSLAAGPYAMYVDSTVKARINNLLPDYGDGKIELEESGGDLGFTLGAMYQFSETTRIGLVYRSELEPELDGTPTFKNLDPLLRETLAAANLLGTEVEVDFKVPAMAAIGFYTELSDQWALTGDLIWLDMSEFGITHLRVEEDSVSVSGKYRDMWATSAAIKYRYAEDRAVSFGGLYASSPVTDDNRDVGLPLDRMIGVGVGLERPIHDYPCHINLNYFDLGDGEVSQDGGPLTGDLDGSFGSNWAVMLDIQVKLTF